MNVPRRHEPVATDTIFSDTPAVDSGVKQAQVFVGRDSLVADVYPMKSGKQFVNTLHCCHHHPLLLFLQKWQWLLMFPRWFIVVVDDVDGLH